MTALCTLVFGALLFAVLHLNGQVKFIEGTLYKKSSKAYTHARSSLRLLFVAVLCQILPAACHSFLPDDSTNIA